MPDVKTVDEIEMEKRIEILQQALRQVLGELKAANKAAAEWKATSNYYFDRYHATRVELVWSRLRMADMNAMIRALTENNKPPEITFGGNFNVT